MQAGQPSVIYEPGPHGEMHKDACCLGLIRLDVRYPEAALALYRGAA